MAKVIEPSEIYKNLSLENLPNEVWVDIDGYENFYQVSSMGRVRSLDRVVMCGIKTQTLYQKIRKQSLDSDGYCVINLFRDGKAKRHKVHRIVGNHFIYNTKNKPHINHKKGIKTDNRVTELEWATVSENNKHSFNIGLKCGKKGESHWNSKLDKFKVLKIRAFLQLGLPISKIGSMFDVSPATIRDISIGTTWKHI